MMKRFLILMALSLPLAACTPSTTPTQATAPATGYVDNYDQQFGQAISAATAFYDRIQADVNAGTYKPSPAELTGLNTFGTALNAAKQLAQTYHNNPNSANLAPAQNSINSLTSQQQTLQAQITNGGK